MLLDNVPEFVFWLEAAALAGAVVVGANPTHRGDELVRDLTHTECQFLVTDSASLPLVDGARIGDGARRRVGRQPRGCSCSTRRGAQTDLGRLRRTR